MATIDTRRPKERKNKGQAFSQGIAAANTGRSAIGLMERISQGRQARAAQQENMAMQKQQTAFQQENIKYNRMIAERDKLINVWSSGLEEIRKNYGVDSEQYKTATKAFASQIEMISAYFGANVPAAGFESRLKDATVSIPTATQE